MPAIIDECYLVRFTIGSVATAQITHTHTHTHIDKFKRELKKKQ